MSFEITLHRGRTEQHTINLYESNGTTSITLAVADVVRFKMWRRDQSTPDLDIDSAAATTNGSVVTVDELGADPVAQVTLKTAEGDMDSIAPGVYDAEFIVQDDSGSDPANPAIPVEQGVVYVMATGGGDTGVA